MAKKKRPRIWHAALHGKIWTEQTPKHTEKPHTPDTIRDTVLTAWQTWGAILHFLLALAGGRRRSCGWFVRCSLFRYVRGSNLFASLFATESTIPFGLKNSGCTFRVVATRRMCCSFNISKLGFSTLLNYEAIQQRCKSCVKL